MQFYDFWSYYELSDDSAYIVGCYGYSNVSELDAKRVARERCEQTLARLRSETMGRYVYGQGVMREPVIERLSRDGGQDIVISRNGYGALVLNVPDVFIGDIDLPRPRMPGLFAWFKGLVGLESGSSDERLAAEESFLELVESIAHEMPNALFRVYRTPSGFRVLLVSYTMNPTDDSSRQLMQKLDCDVLYARLCGFQNCYRARLTAKPYRINMSLPPNRFPWFDEQKKQAFDAWLREYETAANQYSAAEFITQIGRGSVHPAVAPVVELHDLYSCTGHPLA